MLAYYHYPFVSNNEFKEYTEEDLMNPEIVERLFDYCQILEAYITKAGWEFLINHYGYKKLFEIEKKSGWFDEDTIESYIERVQYYLETAEE